MRNKLCVQVWTPDHNQNQLHHLFPHNFLLSPNHIPNSEFRIWDSKQYFGAIAYSRGTKVEKMLTLAPERYTAGFRMVAKVILWCILNHCIADSIDLHNTRAANFLRKPSKIMSKYYFSKCYIFLSKKFRTKKY